MVTVSGSNAARRSVCILQSVSQLQTVYSLFVSNHLLAFKVRSLYRIIYLRCIVRRGEERRGEERRGEERRGEERRGEERRGEERRGEERRGEERRGEERRGEERRGEERRGEERRGEERRGEERRGEERRGEERRGEERRGEERRGEEITSCKIYNHIAIYFTVSCFHTIMLAILRTRHNIETHDLKRNAHFLAFPSISYICSIALMGKRITPTYNVTVIVGEVYCLQFSQLAIVLLLRSAHDITY